MEQELQISISVEIKLKISQQRKPNHDSKSVISLRKRQMRPIIHCGLIPSTRCAQLAQKDSDRQKKLQKVSASDKAAYQHGMNPPKAAMSLTTPEAVSISQMSLSEKTSVEKIVYQQLCMFLLMKKRAAAERGAYL